MKPFFQFPFNREEKQLICGHKKRSMRTKGAANRVRYHRDIKTAVLNELVKFRCSDAFKGLLQDFRNSQSSYIAKRSEGAFIRKAILTAMLRNGVMKPEMLERVKDELEKI